MRVQGSGFRVQGFHPTRTLHDGFVAPTAPGGGEAYHGPPLSTNLANSGYRVPTPNRIESPSRGPRKGCPRKGYAYFRKPQFHGQPLLAGIARAHVGLMGDPLHTSASALLTLGLGFRVKCLGFRV